MFHKQQVTLTGEGDQKWSRQWQTALLPDECDHRTLEAMCWAHRMQKTLAIINGPALCRRQFGSIRNWNTLGLIRQTKPKYPLLVMRTLCHSLTPQPLWPCRKSAQGKHLHFFPASRNCFSKWGEENERQNERAVNCQLQREWWLCEIMAYEKRIWGHLMRIFSKLNAAYFQDNNSVNTVSEKKRVLYFTDTIIIP